MSYYKRETVTKDRNIVSKNTIRVTSKVWVIGDLLIVDRDLFFAIKIAIGDRNLIKRSPDDRDREIQRSRSQKRDLLANNMYINFIVDEYTFFVAHVVS